MKPGVTPAPLPVLEALARSHRRACAVLVVVALALFLPGFFTLQPMDRDEPRFAQASKQMLETGDVVAIRFQTEARNKKPVGIYWMQAAVVGAAEAVGVPDARRRIWLYRIPSLAAAVASVLLAYWTALAFAGPPTALLAALLFGSTLLLGVEARLAKTDAMVCATVLAAMGAMARVYLGAPRGWRLPAIFWTAIGVGLLVKGPITPMVPLLAALALGFKDRSLRWALDLRPLVGLAWALAIVSPWFALIMIETKGAFLRDSVGADMLGKVRSGQEAHGAPPGTYLAAFWATAWPLAPFAPLAAPFVWAQRRSREIAFLLAWLVPCWLVFELTPTKLPHYVLPLYPAVALLTALAVAAGAAEADRRWRRVVLRWLPAFALIVLAVAVGLALKVGAPPGVLWFLAAPVVIGLAVWLARRTGKLGVAEIALASPALALAVYVATYGGVLTGPVAEPVRLSPRLAALHAALVRETPGCPSLAPATTLYREPSLVFLTRTDLAMTTGEGAAAFLKDGPCRVAFIDSRVEKAFQDALGADSRVVKATELRGLNLNGGRTIQIDVMLRGSAP
ncbi:MAG TPA: glycosyltransferase family 39 protein [Beijerinckiaceae bacterium]